MSKPGSGSSGLGPNSAVFGFNAGLRGSMIRGTGSPGPRGASRPYSGVSGRLVEAGKSSAGRPAPALSGRVYREGRFEIRKIHDKRVGRNADRGQVWEVSDGNETAKAYSLESAREMARHMASVSKSERDAKREAMLAQLRNK